MMDAEEALSYLRYEVCGDSRLGLERTRELLARLGSPQERLRFVHVAGTNGKGSASAMLASVLERAGYRVGLYTSPHLTSYRERMRVDGADIPEEDLCALVEQVKPHADAMADKPTEFEVITAMALLYFAQRQCDIVVLEVGLGGRLDATNAIGAPEAAVIMNIGLEHTEILGDTLELIAGEKAGIVKPGCTVVTYPGTAGVEEVYRTICAQRGARWRRAEPEELTPLGEDLDGQRFLWRGRELSIGLLGRHQLSNAAVVLETVEVLREKGWKISEDAVREGLAAARWPARLELLGRGPLFVLDGAHNPQCAQALADGIAELFPGRKIVFLAGVLADKDYGQIMDLMAPLARQFICLTPDSPRALPAAALRDHLLARGLEAQAYEDVGEGILAALTAAGAEGIVVAFGSLYLAGAVREEFRPAWRRWMRREKIGARDALPPEEREERSRRIVERILAWPEFQAAKTVMLYRAVRGEVRLDGLERAAQGKRLVYPQCVEKELRAVLPSGAWKPGPFGIPEPEGESVPPEEIDLVLCPCTAFDEGGGRLGMGGGYYDRFLPKCINAHVAAVAFEVQKVPRVPVEGWDRPVETVFTEDAAYQKR